jgi:mono/diheme cytochrome c family protein
MRRTNIVWTTALIAAAILLTAVLSTASLGASNTGGVGAQQDGVTVTKQQQIARGKYLVEIMGCHDCHTPAKLGPNGPEQDRSRALSGHPEQLIMPPAPAPTGPWVASIAPPSVSYKHIRAHET